jgi:hypothetical protein
MRGVWHYAQPLGVDHRATVLANSVGACRDALERVVDVAELRTRGLIDCAQNFVVLHDDCGVGRVARQRSGLAPQIVVNTAHALA